MSNSLNFLLTIERIENKCRCQLFWDLEHNHQFNRHNQPIFLDYPQHLIDDYQQWQRAYLRYYQNYLRGRVGKQGGLETNPGEQLRLREANLLTDFQNWLSQKLLQVTRTIVDVLLTLKNGSSQLPKPAGTDAVKQINIFLSCSCPQLEKLPWEAWQLHGIAQLINFRLIRTPSNIRFNAVSLANQDTHRTRKTRILAIFGDSTNLNFQEEINALSNLALAQVEIISYAQQQSIEQWRSQICATIADKQGWDLLFFFGHSEEDNTTGGKLGIAPRESISVSEIKPYLIRAKGRGLQFALFNSCSGTDIAKNLIDQVGLSQVIIMREPIHDRVAQDFFKVFLQGLTAQKNVVDTLEQTTQSLQNNINYPSASLIPSIFAYPHAPFFQLQPYSWRAKLKPWLLSRKQLAVFSSIAILSLFPSVQSFLLDQRLLTQAIYRDVTEQVNQQQKPPVVLISIDDESFNQEKIIDRNPLNREYLAKIIDRLAQYNPRIIGVDYLLDRPQGENDTILSRSIQNTIQQNETLFVFASEGEGEQENGILPEIADLNTVTQASIEHPYEYIEIPDDCYQLCPLGYFLALNQILLEKETKKINLNSQKDYKEQILNYFYQPNHNDDRLNFLQQVNRSAITEISTYFRQNWLNPLIDYSLPPQTIYQTIPAWELLAEEQQSFNQSIILIASGGYGEAGIDNQKDYIDPPLSIDFWRAKYSEPSEILTGGEIHAYVIHHWLKQHLVIPIPDLWLILGAIFLNKLIEQRFLSILDKQKIMLRSRTININIFLQLLLIVNLIYFVISLQFYISLKILFPYFLPSLSFWLSFLFSFLKYSHEKY